jgi:hypothetical protein
MLPPKKLRHTGEGRCIAEMDPGLRQASAGKTMEGDAALKSQLIMEDCDLILALLKSLGAYSPRERALYEHELERPAS